MHPTYYVRHPDDTYSVVAPQPAEVLVDAAITTLNQLGRMVGNSEHENNRIRAALTAAFSEADARATPADAGAGMPQQVVTYTADQLRDTVRKAVEADRIARQSPAPVTAEPAGADLLKAARDYIEQISSEPGYGFHRPANPHDFTPDAESCSAEEVAAHRAACEAYDKGEYTPEEGSEWVGSMHILRAPWGIGAYVVRNEYAESLIAGLDRIIATHSAPAGRERSIDTPEFRELLAKVWGAWHPKFNSKPLAALIAHIDRHIAAPAPADRDAIRTEPEVVQSFALEDGRCVIGDPDLGALKDGTYWICKAPVYRAADAAETRDAKGGEA